MAERSPGLLRLTDRIIDLDRALVICDGEELPLTPTEAKLLGWFAGRPGRAIPREVLLTEVWGYAPGVESRAPDNTISRLRSKLEADPREPRHLIKVYGVGYRFECEAGGEAGGEAPAPADDWQPPAREAARRGNLGPEATSFVGRAAALERLAAERQGGNRLLTLSGPGGVGKTRLAQRFAAAEQARGAVPGGAWFVELSEARDALEVVQSLAGALDLPLAGGRTLEQHSWRVGRALRARGRALVVLDNLEQVLEHARPLAAQWLEHAPELTLLATSRRALGLRGERELVLGPLDAREASQLFCERAARVRWGFALAPGEEGALEELVAEQLDGLPLAIELAAARAAVVDLAQLRERLSERWRLLRARGGGRHAALRATLDWSWELLGPGERAALAQCGVFVGGFTLEAAEAVLELSAHSDPDEGELWTPDVLQALRDHSLLQITGEGPGGLRFRMLRAMREYALERLRQRGGFAAASARHQSCYAALGDAAAAKLAGPEAPDALRALAAERQNLTAAAHRAAADGRPEQAARCALALAHVLDWRGPLSAWVAESDRALETPGLAPGWRSRLLESRARALARLGQLQPALADADAALAAAGGDPQLQVAAGLRRADLLGRLGRPDEAAEAMAAARAGLAAAPAMAGSAEDIQGILWLRQGALDRALSSLQRSLALARSAGDLRLVAATLSHLGLLRWRSGRYDEALECYGRARALHEEAGDPFLPSLLLGNLGLVYHELGRFEQARATYQEALGLHADFGDLRSEALVSGNLGLLLSEWGYAAPARARLEAALRIHRDLGDARMQCVNLGSLGAAALDRGDPGTARRRLEEARGLADALPGSHAAQVVRLRLGEVALATGRGEEAGVLLEEALEALDALGDRAGATQAAGALGELVAGRGEAARADALLTRAEQALRALGSRYELALLLCRRGRVAATGEAAAEAAALAAALGVLPGSRLGRELAALQRA